MIKIPRRNTIGSFPRPLDIPLISPTDEFVSLVDVARSPTKLKPIIETAWKGFKSGISPELCEEGVGGTYFMRDEFHHPIGVFKPQDEEPYHINNPKGYSFRRNSVVGLKQGIQIGEAAIRECAAYMLDHNNFAGVPATDLALCQHPDLHYQSEDTSIEDDMFPMEDMLAEIKPTKVKVGSFQEFVKHDGDCEDISRKFIEKFSVSEVHKICQLDIRLLNSDRHGGNILYKKYVNELQIESYQLIPIDHGYTLPATLDEGYFVWLTWPQAKLPIEGSTKAYIDALNVEEEVQQLKEKFGETIREEHFKVLRICNMLLKTAANAGLTFYDIAVIMCRHNLQEPCKLEVMCEEAQKMSTSDDQFYENLHSIMLKQFNSI
eukprot:TRINITY_DN1528_c0_g1_i1.p1 TRINITY_DN1528_c0_g1~~TRINITY_DN1528_c0_g1_i1.p1  ORF type:complete len:377 (+),score=131.53 TRINITY_DN1528_c0_g1_i1:379-1509(+)